MSGRILGLIPARGGSRSIPRKNIRPFLGKPLLLWTVEGAIESGVCHRILLSTDDPEIAHIGEANGVEVPFLRPAEYATDTTPTAPVVRHAVDWLIAHEDWTPEFIFVLEPTSPGRQPFHIRESLAVLRNRRADSVASVIEVPHHYVPSKQLAIGSDGCITGIDGMHPRDMVHRRQDLPTYYSFDGSIFACRLKDILQDPPTLWGDTVLAYRIESRYGVDLDSPADWAPAEARLRAVLLERTP